MELISYTSFYGDGLGHIAVAASPQGICGVFLEKSQETAFDKLLSAFPAAKRVSEDQSQSQTHKLLYEGVSLLKQALSCEKLSSQQIMGAVDLSRCTPFQQEVYRALSNLPVGKTISYSELAGAIGHPRAVRAVASACAKNPVCLLIPCHRVIYKNGKTGHYGGRFGIGATTKETLLVREFKTQAAA